MKRLIFLPLFLAACQTDKPATQAGMSTGFPKCDELLTKLQTQDNAVAVAMKAKTPANVAYVANASAYFTQMALVVPTVCPDPVVRIVVPEVKARIPALDKFVNS